MTTKQVTNAFLDKLKKEPISVWILTIFLSYQIWYLNHRESEFKVEREKEIMVRDQENKTRKQNTLVMEKLLYHFKDREKEEKQNQDKILEYLIRIDSKVNGT